MFFLISRTGLFSGFFDQRLVVFDHASHGLQLVHQFDLLSLFFSNNVDEAFDMAGTVSVEWSTDLCWRRNQTTFEDLVDVVNRLSW